MDAATAIRGYLTAAGVKNLRPSPEGFYSDCPFHHRHHRSKGMPFSVNVKKGVFACMSQACGRTGTIATILYELLGVPWRRAKEILQRMCLTPRADLEVLQVLPPYKQRFEVRDDLEALDPATLGIFDRCPKYMLRRGFTKQTLKAWDIGYDPDSRRVTFPVWTQDGRLVGFTKRRAYETDDPYDPAYVHHGFKRSLVLYGADRVEGVTEASPVVVHESTMSVLWQYQHHVPNPVSTLGAKVSQQQVSMLAKYPWVTLCFDGDAAGVAATNRTLHGTEVLERQPNGRWGRIFRPGLAALLPRGHVKVIAGWPRGFAKDLQEHPQPAQFLQEHAVSWAEWERLRGRTG